MAKKYQRAAFEGVQARFDNARHTPDTASMFRNVDSFSVNVELNPLTRRTVRDRARYVVANCPYAWGMLDTYATDVVGPWVTVTFPRDGVPDAICTKVSEAFDAWALKANFWEKLKTMVRAKTTDGEAFAMFYTDPTLVDETNRVKLNIADIECDRVESWTEAILREDEFDGIRFDAYRHPVAYRILKYHPGDYRAIRNIRGRGGDWVKAANVIHYFEPIRPEQVRGISDFVSMLDIPAEQKSYRSSVTETAINAASISGILHTNLVPECYGSEDEPLGKCAMNVKPNTVFQVQRGALVTLPEGYDMTQMRAEQPTSLYPDFVRALIAEMARCLSMPVNIAMCDSSRHNFASAKLDFTIYNNKLNDVRGTLVKKVLDRVFYKWLEEYAIVERIDAATLTALRKTEWLFADRSSADVMKDASADNTRLGNATLSHSAYYAKQGKDGDREMDQCVADYIHLLVSWRKQCKANGLPEDTPCPFFAKGGGANPAPTEDMVEHDSQKNLNPNNGARK